MPVAQCTVASKILVQSVFCRVLNKINTESNRKSGISKLRRVEDIQGHPGNGNQKSGGATLLAGHMT